LRKQFTAWYAKEIFKDTNESGVNLQMPPQTQKQKAKDHATNDATSRKSSIEESDDILASYSEDSSSGEGGESDNDDRGQGNEDSTSEDVESSKEFEPVDTSAARMKSLGGKWLCEYLQNNPSILG